MSLDDLPDARGFRLRGVQMTRIETFTDAAFAFAVTLLVVSIDAIPTSYQELVAAMRGVPAFAIAFALLFMFWYAHHDWSRRYGLDDFLTVVLSAVLVFLVMVYVYPLKMISHGIVGALSSAFGAEYDHAFTLDSAAELNGLFLVYGLGFVAMSATIVGCYAHAWRLRSVLELDELERFDTRMKMREWTVMGTIGVFSCILAVLIPDDHPIVYWALPGWAYMLNPVVMPFLGYRVEKARERLVSREASS